MPLLHHQISTLAGFCLFSSSIHMQPWLDSSLFALAILQTFSFRTAIPERLGIASVFGGWGLPQRIVYLHGRTPRIRRR